MLPARHDDDDDDDDIYTYIVQLNGDSNWVKPS